MAKRSAKPKRDKSIQNSGIKADRRKSNKGRIENLKPFPLGVSGNPGGRPKRVTDAYREWLEQVNEQAGGLTNAQLLARSMGIESLKGNVSAAGEIRKATEGERIRTWRDEVIDLLRDGKITLDDVKQDLGEDIASELTLAAGIRRGESGEAHPANTADG